MAQGRIIYTNIAAKAKNIADLARACVSDNTTGGEDALAEKWIREECKRILAILDEHPYKAG